MNEGLAGLLSENSHKIPVAQLPTQPVPPTSLGGVVPLQPPSPAIIQQQLRPPMGQPGMRPQGPGGIQGLLQSQVPVPPGQLPNTPQMQQHMFQQQQLQQQRMQQQQQREQQMRQQQLQQQQQQQQQIRMQQMQQQQQQQQQASNNFEPPQQIVSMQQRLPHPVQFP